MKVFRIHNDINNFQYFLTEQENDWEKLVMDCTKMLKRWAPPPVFIYKPKHKQGNFFNFDSGLLTCDPEATETLRSYLEMAGELLSLPYEGKEYSILNVTECINCLNQEKTEWIYGKSTGSRIGIKNYSFHPNRFSESVIFKIPETSKTEILVVEGLKDPDEELQFVVESTGLKGLVFELIWEG